MSIIIGIDPHKATHTAVAIGGDESELATVTVRATRQQTDELISWAEPFTKRTWAIVSNGLAVRGSCPRRRGDIQATCHPMYIYSRLRRGSVRRGCLRYPTSKGGVSLMVFGGDPISRRTGDGQRGHCH